MSTFFDPNEKKNKPIISYFENKSWLILESSASTRTSMKKTITQLGAKLSNMFDADNFLDAEKILNSKKPNYIIGNKNVNGGTITNIFNIHLKIAPNRLENGFFVITEENSMAEVAWALEYDMDGIISLPFTGATIIDTILSAIKHKMAPGAYLKKLEEGREKYFGEDLDSASRIFQEALPLHKHPYEAHYYLGKLKSENNLDEEAIHYYEESIFHNPDFYKALKNLSSLYYHKKNYTRAYDTYMHMSEKYPPSPDKIPELIRLSIINQHYEDIINYFKIFNTIHAPNPEIQINISAGLAILGKYFLGCHDLEKGIEALKGSFKYCNGKCEILKSISESFHKFEKINILFDLFEQADITLWPAGAQAIYFHTMHLSSSDDNRVVMTGEKLIKNKCYDFLIYQGLIERAVKMKRKMNYIEGLVLDGIQHLPKYKNELEALLQEVERLHH